MSPHTQEREEMTQWGASTAPVHSTLSPLLRITTCTSGKHHKGHQEEQEEQKEEEEEQKAEEEEEEDLYDHEPGPSVGSVGLVPRALQVVVEVHT